tara:strand:- start:1762 stop:1986 length:225 start_codon:yes stop_codon:yes gene_type:complete
MLEIGDKSAHYLGTVKNCARNGRDTLNGSGLSQARGHFCLDSSVAYVPPYQSETLSSVDRAEHVAEVSFGGLVG